MTVFSHYKEARTVQEPWVVKDYEACAGKEVNAAFAVSPAAGKLQQFKPHLLNSLHACYGVCFRVFRKPAHMQVWRLLL